MRTEVGIIGAGPAGLLLSHLLHREGVNSVVVEERSRSYVEARIRAGVLEQGTADLLDAVGLGDRMRREGLRHEGIWLRFAGRDHRIDFADLTGGRGVTVYGQHEVVKDLIAARLAAGGRIWFETRATAIEGIDGEHPRIRVDRNGAAETIDCAVVAGCDGYHGIARAALPAGVLTVHERTYPFAWLGILAEAPPASEELIYARHDDGFALLSMRSPSLSRLYVQCPPDDDLADWPDARIWEALQTRLAGGGRRLAEGPVLQKGITAMRSFVAEPMRWGRLVLAGDAAHIVPPTGAKGMNLAVADVRVLARALVALLREGRSEPLDAYSATCLGRVWAVQRFSWWMTAMLHRFGDETSFDSKRQRAELDYLVSSRAAQTALAENYVGLPFEGLAPARG